MFVNTQGGGMCFGFPDVCMTPILVPVPIPYPNIAIGPMAMPFTAALNTLIECMPAHTLETMGTLSFGDEPGIELGVLSGLVMGPNRFFLGSFTVLIEGMPAARLTSFTGHNGFSFNGPGLSIVPSQFTVLDLAA